MHQTEGIFTSNLSGWDTTGMILGQQVSQLKCAAIILEINSSTERKLRDKIIN